MEPQRQDIQKLTAALNNLSRAMQSLIPSIMNASEAASRLMDKLDEKENGAQKDDEV